MSDALFAVQQAVFNALTSSGEITALLGSPPRLYDHVPPGAVFPYVVFGASAAKPHDDLDRTGFDQTVTLDIWSRYRGSKEAKDIAQAAYDTLHRANLSVSGEIFIDCEFADVAIAIEPDGLTTRAEVRFTVTVQSS
jgi:uncharacterized protein DUF3168